MRRKKRMSSINKVLYPEYNIEAINNVMSLRKPQKNSLKILDNILDEIDLRIKTEKLQRYMKEVLTARERLIVSLRFGLIGGREKTQREIAKQLGISRSYVSRIEKKALIKLYEKFVSTPI